MDFSNFRLGELTRHKLNHGQQAAIAGLSYLKEVLDISRYWEDK